MSSMTNYLVRSGALCPTPNKKNNAMVLDRPTETGRRFDFPPESLKIPADKVKSTTQWMVQQANIPLPVANAMFASMWFLNVDAFRSMEEDFMLTGKYDDAIHDHRAMLANIIADGEAVILGARKNGMATTPGNFTVDDIQATLNSLHTSFYCEHGPKNSPKMNQIIEGLFDGEKR
jgi:hypothetical protein